MAQKLLIPTADKGQGINVEKKQRRILLVDDEANVRTVFSDILKKESYIVKEAKDGPEAMKAIDEETFDLALRKGAFDYLNKPFSPQQLKSNIKKALEGAGGQKSTVFPLPSGS